MEKIISLRRLIIVLVLFAVAEIIVGLITNQWDLVSSIYFGGLMFTLTLFFGWGDTIK